MSIARQVLHDEVQEQTEKLKMLESEYADTILAGAKARGIVERQRRHVAELCAAIDVLIAHEKSQQVETS